MPSAMMRETASQAAPILGKNPSKTRTARGTGKSLRRVSVLPGQQATEPHIRASRSRPG
jgi:hypothetical protein